MHPPLGSHNTVPYPTEDMVSCPVSLSKNSSTGSLRLLPPSTQNIRTAAYKDTSSIKPRLSAVDAPVLLPCPCEDAEGRQSKMMDLLLPTGHFYGGESQIGVDGSASIPTRQPQLLRHPPENWTEEVSQEIRFHNEEMTTRKTFYTGIGEKPVRPQADDDREHSISRRRYQGASETDNKKVKGRSVVPGRGATATDAVKAVVANQANPLTLLSYSHGERGTPSKHQVQLLADTESSTSNLLRSLSADVTEKKYAAQSLSKSHPQEDQLGTVGSQKPRSRNFWTAARSVCKSPSAHRKPSHFTEKGRHLHRAISSVKDIQRKGERQKTGPEEKVKYEEDQNFASGGKAGLGSRFAGGTTSLDTHSLPPRENSLNPCEAQWRARSGQSPVAFSFTKPEHASTRPVSPRNHPAAGLPRRPGHHSSNTHLLSPNLVSKPHIFVRSYRTFQQERARQRSPRIPGEIVEDKPEGYGPWKFTREQDETIPGKSCLGASSKCNTNSRGSLCEEASSGVQKKPSPFGGRSPSFPPVSNTEPSGEESKGSAAKSMIQNGDNPSRDAHTARSLWRRTASPVSRRPPRETEEDSDIDLHGVLPQRMFLKRLLGSGAMGHVYLVELDERPYALKIALQSDPAACMYLRQGWRNLVHLEKIHQQRQKESAKQTRRFITKYSYHTETEQKTVSRCTSPGCAHQAAAQVTGRQDHFTRRTTAAEEPPALQQPNANDERSGLQLVDGGRTSRRHGHLRKEPETRIPGKHPFVTTQVDCAGTQHNDARELMIHSLNGDLGCTTMHESRQVTAGEGMTAPFRMLDYKEKPPFLPSPAPTGAARARQIGGVCRNPGEHHLGKASANSARSANCGKIVKPEKRDRYFCRPVAFVEGEWFRFESFEQAAVTAPAAPAKLANMPLLHLQRTSTDQKLPSCELLAQHTTARGGAAVCFASHSSRGSPPLRKQKQGCHAVEEQAAANVPPRVPICAYLMEYIPDACQLTAVIWNLHRCIDPSHVLRRDCLNSVVGQRLVEIGLCVAEAHKYIAAEAGLYSFDFNPKNILICVLPDGGRDSSPLSGASTTKSLTLQGPSSCSSLAAARVMRTGTGVNRGQKEEAKTLCNTRPFPCVPSPSQQQLQQQCKGQQQQQGVQLHMHQQHGQQHQTRRQGHKNLSPADITRMVLCDPQVQFRVVAIDLDCSLQAPFSSSAGPSRATDVIGSSSSLSPPQMENLLGPLLDWSCGRRVVYSCPHVSSITAAYIVAVLAKNKGEGQFTRSGLNEAAAHAALCCRIDSKDNFLHYLWDPPERETSKDPKNDEQAKTPVEKQRFVSTVDPTKTSSPLSDGAARIAIRYFYSSEHVSHEVQDQQLEGGSCRTQAKEKRAAHQEGQVAVDGKFGFPLFPSSCIPAEVSASAHAPAQKRPAPAATELPRSSLLRVCSSCTSPTKFKSSSTSRANALRGDSCPKLVPSSNGQPVARGSTSSTNEHITCLKPQVLPLAYHGKRSCMGRLAETMRDMVDSSPGAACNAGDSNGSTGSINTENLWPCSNTAHKHATVSPRAGRGGKEHVDKRNDVSEACGYVSKLHPSNPAALKRLEVSTSKPSALLRHQLHLPCFLYPRWGPKTPRGICQKDYSNYGVRLVGQHVNLQLLSFILCELLDFRSLHVVVLQRFCMELRALHLPTGICQMFSEQDQIISCLCFSALTRMTSAVVPPLRFLSPASTNFLPTSTLRLVPTEASSLTQRRSIVPSPFNGKAAVAVCWCQEIQESHHDSKGFDSLQPKEAVGTDGKERDRGDAVALNENRQDALWRTEKCFVAGATSHEILLKDGALISSADDGPAALLLQKHDTDDAILLLPCAAAEGRACISLLKGCAGKTERQIVSAATGAASVNSRSPDATTWRTCIEPHGRTELFISGKEDCQRCKCNQGGSPRREAGKKEVGQEGDGDTQAPGNHPDTRTSIHTGSISLCMRRRKNDRLSQRKQVNQRPRLLPSAGCYTTPITACQSKLRDASREPAAAETATFLCTREVSATVAPALARQTASCLPHKEQQLAGVESPHGAPEAGDTPKAYVLSPSCTQRHQEKWINSGVKTQWQREADRLTEGSPFGVYAGSQRPDEIMHSNASELQTAAELTVGARYRMGPVCPASLSMLRHQQELQQERAQQEQQQKVRRLMPEEISRMSVWDKVEQLPALNPQDFLPPLHLFGTFCTQEVAALNAVLVQFLDPHPFFALQYSSSTSAFDSIIHALRQLQRRLASLREDACS